MRENAQLRSVSILSSSQRETSIMPEIATQTEVLDTCRNVSTQCGNNKKLMVSVLVEHKILREIKTKPRILTNPKKKAPRKPGMSVSAVNTEKLPKPVLKKCVGTESQEEIKTEPEILILKEIKINHMRIAASKRTTTRQMHKEKENQRENLPGVSKKIKRKLSRQELLYRDILESQSVPRNKKFKTDENREEKKKIEETETRRKQRELEKERRKRIAARDMWEEKIQQWSPSQKWPINEEWERTEKVEGKQRPQHSNRETYLYLKF